MSELDRVRWHCRRGLLELDLVLQRFNAAHLERLPSHQLRAYIELLDYPDNDLLDLVMGRRELPPGLRGEVVRLLRTV